MLFFNRCHARRLMALALAGWALASHAQQRLSAEQAVALALSQPHVRQDLDAEVDLARSEVLAARTWDNPVLEFSEERGDDGPQGASRESSTLLSQTFELGGRRGLRTEAARLGVIAAEGEAEYKRMRLRAGVLRAYSAAVAAERRADVQARAAEGLGDLASVAGKRRAAGDLSGYESRRIAQASVQARARRAQADAEATAARASLAGWIGDAALTAQLDADPPLPELPSTAASGEIRTAELDVLDARRTQARAAARAERRPALPLTVGIGRKRIEEGGVRDDVALLEVGVPLPLFDRNQAGRVRTAAEAERAEAQYQRALLQAHSHRAAAFEQARLLSASARQLLDDALPEAARLTTIARASFAEGELDLVGLLDAYDAEAELTDRALEQQTRALDALIELQLLSPLTIPTHDPSR
ncbi:MAG: TolC family protein [Lysobacteraceae bacterium]|nr:MAG: TolC family protein [Xanthomonadaceae bacterium]